MLERYKSKGKGYQTRINKILRQEMLKEATPAYGKVNGTPKDDEDSCRSFPDNLYQHPLVPHPIELKVEDLFPGTEIELAITDGDHGFPTHDGSLKVRVGVVLESVVLVLAVGFFWSQLFQPALIILVQPPFIVVDEHTGGDVHRVH